MQILTKGIPIKLVPLNETGLLCLDVEGRDNPYKILEVGKIYRIVDYGFNGWIGLLILKGFEAYRFDPRYFTDKIHVEFNRKKGCHKLRINKLRKADRDKVKLILRTIESYRRSKYNKGTAYTLFYHPRRGMILRIQLRKNKVLDYFGLHFNQTITSMISKNSGDFYGGYNLKKATIK